MQTLVAAALALVAAGLAPRVFSPGLASIQSAVRERPEIEALLLLASIVTAGMLLVGGVLGDADGRRRIMLVALGGLVVTGIGGLFVADGPLFLAGRFVDVASASIVLPIALAGVATAYQGVDRATAIGLAYGAYGAASAAAPVLLTLFGPTGSRAPAFAAAAAAAIIAFVYSRRHWRDLPTAGPSQRITVLITAVWAFGIVVITAGVIGFQGGNAEGGRVGLILIGLALFGAGLFIERRRRRAGRPALPIQRRADRRRPLRRLHHRVRPDGRTLPGPGLLPADPRLRAGPVGDRHDPVHGRARRRRPRGRDPACPVLATNLDGRRDPRGRPRQHRHRRHPATGRRVRGVRDLVRVDRGRLRHRDHGPDGDHLRQRSTRTAGHRRGAQRGVGGAREPGRPCRRHGPGDDPRARQLCRLTRRPDAGSDRRLGRRVPDTPVRHQHADLRRPRSAASSRATPSPTRPRIPTRSERSCSVPAS